MPDTLQQSLVKSSVCQTIAKLTDSLLMPLESALAVIEGALNALKAFIATIPAFQPGKKIHDLCGALLKDVNLKKMIPDLKMMDELVDLINACPLLSGDNNFKHPSALINGMIDDLMAMVNGIIDDLTGMLPEFTAGQMLNALLKQIKTNKIDLGINNYKSGLDCLKNLCGVDIKSRLDKFQALLDKFYFTGSGDFDIGKFLMDGCGLNLDQCNIILMAQVAVDKIYKRVDTAIENAKNAVTGEFDKIVDATEKAEAMSSSLYQKGKDLFEGEDTQVEIT